MTTFKKYLWHRLKETNLTTLVFTLLSVIFTLSVVMEETTRYVVIQEAGSYYEAEVPDETGIYILAVILGIFCTLIPILETAGFKNRRNLDMFCFLPMSRFKLALAHYVGGFIQVTVIYTVSFAVQGLYLINYASYFKLAYLPLYYILSLLLGLVIYSFFIFLFGTANSVVDGVIFCTMWIFALWFASGSFYGVLQYYFYSFFSVEIEAGSMDIIPQLHGLYDVLTDVFNSKTNDWKIVYIPINNCTMIFQQLIENRGDGYFARQVETIVSEAYMFAVWGIIGIASTYGYLKNFAKHKVESTGEISNTVFGYKLLIPLYGYFCLISTDYDYSMKIMFWAMMIAGYAIYRRGIKFKKSDIIALAVGFILVLTPQTMQSTAWFLFFGTPVASAIWLGYSICSLIKAKRRSSEAGEKLAKAETIKRIICMVIAALLLIFSIAAIFASIVLLMPQ